MPNFFPDFSRRSSEAEMMDGCDFTPEEVHSAYADLRKVNRYLGGTKAVLRHLEPLIEATPSRPVKILDIGTGSADIPRAVVQAARRNGVEVKIVALDASSYAMKAAGETTRGIPEIYLVQGQALQLPFVERSFDVVIASELLHHLPTEVGGLFLRRLQRMARVAFLINDLRRHPIPYASFWILSHLFSQNRIIRHDGLVSILRGFAPEDIRELQRQSELDSLTVHYHFPYRIVLVGRRDHHEAHTDHDETR